MIKTFVGFGCTVCFFLFKVHTYLSGTSVCLILYSYFVWIFLTGRILITIYDILKYLSCIKIAYNNNNKRQADQRKYTKETQKRKVEET